jgi:hypothetical protein
MFNDKLSHPQDVDSSSACGIIHNFVAKNYE